MKAPRVVLLAALVVTGACSAAASGPSDPADRTLDGVGVLPHEGAAMTLSSVDDASSPSAVPSSSEVIDGVTGSRVIVIGDSVLASTSARYSNDMCEALVPLGWRVEVDAETSRFIDFADQVLDKRLSAGFDAVVIGLGSNYGKKEAVFHDYLEAAVVRVSPRPVVLVTVTEFDPSRKEVNHAIAEIAAAHPNVAIADWATVSKDKSLLGPDGLHLTPKGRTRLAATVAATLGTAPTQPGDCLKTSFADDSGGSVEGGPATTVNKSTATTTTAKPTGTTKPTSPTTTTRPPSSTVPTSTGTSTTTPAVTTTQPSTTTTTSVVITATSGANTTTSGANTTTSGGSPTSGP